MKRMIYSGADLIRTSGQQQERVVKLNVPAVSEVKPTGESKSRLDEETQGALLRFARFIHKDGQKNSSQKKTKGSKNHPYIKAQQADDRWFEVGQNLDIYV